MPLLAFVTLSEPAAAVSDAQLQIAWRQLWPDEALVLEPGAGTSWALQLSGRRAGVTQISSPFPWSELEGPAACAWHWPEATAALQGHAAHVVISVPDLEPDVQAAVCLTRLTAAVIAATPGATGVLWGAGTAVVSAERFLAVARGMTPETLPVLCWLELRVFPDAEVEGAWCLFTTGLAPLGLMEIEVSGSTTPPQQLIQEVFAVAHYQLKAGPVLADGHMIRGLGEERVLVLHAPSAWERSGPVLRLML